MKGPGGKSLTPLYFSKSLGPDYYDSAVEETRITVDPSPVRGSCVQGLGFTLHPCFGEESKTEVGWNGVNRCLEEGDPETGKGV